MTNPFFVAVVFFYAACGARLSKCVACQLLSTAEGETP